jgi:hypothetical protein
VNGFQLKNQPALQVGDLPTAWWPIKVRLLCLSELTARATRFYELVTRAELAWKPGQRNLYMLEECTFYILPDTYCC